MKQKRRKKQAGQWALFQQEHQLSDQDLQLARSMSYPLEKLQEKLADGAFASDVSTSDRSRRL